MKKSINLLLVLAAIAALAVSVVEVKRLHASAEKSRDALAAVLKRNAAMKAQLNTLKPVGAQQANAAANTDAPAGTAAKNKDADKQRAQALLQAQQYIAQETERVAKDPEFALKHYSELRSEASTKYALFSRVHRLSKEQSEALAEADFQQSLRTDKISSQIAAQVTAQMAAGKRPTGPDANSQSIYQQARDEFEATVRKALGEDLYAQLELFEKQRSAWDYVSNFGCAMSLVDMPLSMEQASRLAGAIANANAAYQKVGTVLMMPGTRANFALTTDWKAVDAAAAEFLTPEQLEFFRNVDAKGIVGGKGMVSSRQEDDLANALQNLPPE